MTDISWLAHTRRHNAIALGILVAGGVVHQALAIVLVIGFINMMFLPPATQRAQDQWHMAGEAVGRLNSRTGARGFVRDERGLRIRLHEQTLPVTAFLERFPLAAAEVEQVTAASAVCMAYFPIGKNHSVCVQWRRDDRVGGLTGRQGLQQAGVDRYRPVVEWLGGDDDLVQVVGWSADAALLDDWEALVPFVSAPAGGRVRAETAVDARVMCTRPTRNGSLPRGSFFNTAGFAFSTPCSRVGLEKMAGEVLRPVVDVQVAAAWDVGALPQQLDMLKAVFICESEQHCTTPISPLRIERDRSTLERRLHGLADTVIAEFAIAEFRHGRTIVFSYDSGRTKSRTIALNGVM